MSLLTVMSWTIYIVFVIFILFTMFGVYFEFGKNDKKLPKWLLKVLVTSLVIEAVLTLFVFLYNGDSIINSLSIPLDIKTSSKDEQIKYINAKVEGFKNLEIEKTKQELENKHLVTQISDLTREKNCESLSSDFYTTVNCINIIMQKELSGSINFTYQKDLPIKQRSYMHIQHAFGLIGMLENGAKVTNKADDTIKIINKFRKRKQLSESNIFNDYTLSLIVREYFIRNVNNN